MSRLKVVLIGDGKMGLAIDALASERGVTVTNMLGENDVLSKQSLKDADVAIEFTEPKAAVGNILKCVELGMPVVVGTTGWYDRLASVEKDVKAKNGLLLWAANFSLGVNILFELAREAGELFAGAAAFDAHIVETHHLAKKDAPSGTGMVLESCVRSTLGRSVPITSVRTGAVPGTHELIFDAPFEQLTITHTARDRRVFADGALVAADWLARKKGQSGVFTMRDVLKGIGRPND